MSRILTSILIPAGLLLAAGAPAVPALSETDHELSFDGTPFVCTGVAESRTDPRWDAYSLRLVFAGARGAYVGDIYVRISDSSGAVILNVHCGTPWVLADLPPGSYSVEAIADGHHRKSFTVRPDGNGQSIVTTYFEEITER